MADAAGVPPGRTGALPGRVIPYLAVRDAVQALAFYTEAFGAEEKFRLEDGGRVGHAEFSIGGATFYLADEWPEMSVRSPASLGGWSVSLAIEVADADAFVAHLVKSGARVERDEDDGPGPGRRQAWVVDPYGHRWHISAPA